MKKSSKEYHYDTKQGIRNDKLERLTRLFTFEEQQDRNNIAATIGTMPSPRNTSWRHYIAHRLRMMENGIETYTQRNVARLRLDKHIESHRIIDRIVARLVNFLSAIILIGAGHFAANSPISIKKHVRCPGTRKLIGAFKKRGNCVVRMVDEYMTSQHCGKCFKRFPQWTRPKRFKLCDDCRPDENIMRLPTAIVTNVSKRALQMQREIMRVWREMAEDGDAVAAILTQRNAKRLVSKKQTFLKTWQSNNANAEMEDAAKAEAQPRKTVKTVWHRDISAARLILYRGIHSITIEKLLLF